jgi:cytochrome c biogenesis protein
MASVKLTLVVFLALALLSIPGTVVLQYNMSNVDPGLQYDYDFWRFGQWTQLFTAYHSVWYVALIVLLSVNLIACSEQRWPGMWKLATAKPKALSPEALDKIPDTMKSSWQLRSAKDRDAYVAKVMHQLKSSWNKPVIVEQSEKVTQVFWQTGRWSRLANYLVHSSLLVIFAGAIVSSMYGFEGAANIPEGAAIDTFLIFKEGKTAGLKKVNLEGALENERFFGFRVQAESFDVKFYEDFPGRPKEFVSRLNFIEGGQVKQSSWARVNEPVEYGGFTFYQASYGPLGDFDLGIRAIPKSNFINNQVYVRTQLGKPEEIPAIGKTLVAIRAMQNVQGLGPGVLIQEMSGDQSSGEPFWILRDHPTFDLTQRPSSSYTLVLDKVDERFFTGLQVGYDPGAAIYWWGCLFMIIGTFYALLVQHKKFYLRIEGRDVLFAATVHRLPLGFEKQVNRLSASLKKEMES